VLPHLHHDDHAEAYGGRPVIAHLKTWRPRPIRERLKTARTILRPLGLRIYTCAPGEYRVAFSGDLQNEAAAYYTADVQDAIDTGIDMHARRARAIDI